MTKAASRLAVARFLDTSAVSRYPDSNVFLKGGARRESWWSEGFTAG